MKLQCKPSLTRIKENFIHVKLDTDNKKKKTETKNIDDNLIFKERFTFPIDSKEKILIYRIYSASNPKNPLGEVEVPLFILNINNEAINPQFEFKDINQKNIASFKPKIIVVTSFYEMYKKQYDNIEENIEQYKDKIAQLSDVLSDISLPYKKQCDEFNTRMKKYKEERAKQDKFTNINEGKIKGSLGQKEINSDKICKLNKNTNNKISQNIIPNK